MDPRALLALNAARRQRRAVMLITDLGGGGERVVGEGEALDGSPGGSLDGPLGEAVAEAFRSGRSRLVEADGRSLFLNVHLPPPRLVIVGAVHISQALAPMARLAGFDVSIVDPRTAFATPGRFGGETLEAEWPEAVLARRPLDAFTALAAVTHDPKIDDLPLRAALAAGCFYVGALGSRKTHAGRVARLLAQGVGAADIARIHAPIGLNIAAATPAEIAVAVLAQIVQALRGRGRGGEAGSPAA